MGATMQVADVHTFFDQETLDQLLPRDRADQFFEALLGDASEGAYDISLKFKDHQPKQRQLFFELHLTQRPGKCLACNLTYGLPEVFSRHPILNLKGVVEQIAKTLGHGNPCQNWRLGSTQTVSHHLHVIPLMISL